MTSLFCFFEGYSSPKAWEEYPSFCPWQKGGKVLYPYLWHGKPCRVLVEPVYKPKVVRNCLIELETGERIVVPRRAIRKRKEGLCH